MNEKMKKFIEELSKNEKLQQELSKCESPEEAYKLATSYVDGYTSEEFFETMKKLNETIEKLKNNELTEDDLAQASGGIESEETMSYITLVSAVVTITPPATIGLAALAATI